MSLLAKVWMLASSLALATGCSGWQAVPLNRAAILGAALESKEVRITTARGQRTMTVNEVNLPAKDSGLRGGFLRGTSDNESVIAYFQVISLLEAREPSFWRSKGFEETMNGLGYGLVVVGLIALAIFAANNWTH